MLFGLDPCMKFPTPLFHLAGREPAPLPDPEQHQAELPLDAGLALEVEVDGGLVQQQQQQQQQRRRPGAVHLHDLGAVREAEAQRHQRQAEG